MRTIKLPNGNDFAVYTPSELRSQMGTLTIDNISRFDPDKPDEDFIYSCMSGRFGWEIKGSELMRRTVKARLGESRHFGAFNNPLGMRNPQTPTNLPEHDCVREELLRIYWSVCYREALMKEEQALGDCAA